jgi:hypothetical protein
MKHDMIFASLDHKFFVIREKLAEFASLIKEILERVHL